MLKFKFKNMPSTPVEQDAHADAAASSVTPSTPTSLSSSPGSFESGAKMSSRWQHRRRRRGAPRNTEKRPYHAPTHVSPPHDRPMTKSDMYFALDCEMVGVGPEGLESAVARVTICNWTDKVLLDTFVKVPVRVTDYRTFVSGIEAKDLEGNDALSPAEVRTRVRNILSGKILIGHALENDLAALQISHPWHDIRDTANYPPFMKKGENDSGLRPRKLKELVKDKLGGDIQDLGRAHDPVEDARAALALYKSVRLEWEQWIMTKVESARIKEGGDGEPTGLDDREGQYGACRPPSVGPPPPASLSYANAHSMYARSRSAPAVPTAAMAPPQGYAYYQQQQYLY